MAKKINFAPCSEIIMAKMTNFFYFFIPIDSPITTDVSYPNLL
ncbi:hypothetical protein [Clostridium botulinum]|nr:hypothetical protein [Clostridium botulinum]